MGLFSKMFNSDRHADKTETPNFDNLVRKARTSGNPTDLNELYKNLLTLNHWTYLSPSRLEVENAKPFIGLVDEKPWVFVFTDRQKANQYGRQFDGFVKPDGSVFVMQMTVKGSLDMLYQLSERGVFGIRVNEGENGWFCPIKDLPNIIKHLDLKIV